jgi:hypothetical protein
MVATVKRRQTESAIDAATGGEVFTPHDTNEFV